MQWSMPPRVLQIVAGLIGLTAATSFTLGVLNAPQRGRLPGERVEGSPAALIQATEATPLSQERIEGPPPPPELTEEEKAKLEAEKQAKAEADAAAKLAAQTPTIRPILTPPPLAVPPPDRVGDVLDATMPPPDEPPH
jgi:hypothetical protein